MTNLSEFNGGSGSVILRGVEVPVGSDIGAAFTTDCCRFVESLVTETQVREKWDLGDEAWQALASNVALQRAVGATKERRIHNGDAAREKAAHLLVEAVGIVGDIARDAGSPPRSRIEAARELRQVAAVGADDTPTAEKERFHISINFGTAKIVRDVELKPIKSELTIEAGRNEDEDGEFGF
jgi:hypothetical protein